MQQSKPIQDDPLAHTNASVMLSTRSATTYNTSPDPRRKEKSLFFARPKEFIFVSVTKDVCFTASICRGMQGQQ